MTTYMEGFEQETNALLVGPEDLSAFETVYKAEET